MGFNCGLSQAETRDGIHDPFEFPKISPSSLKSDLPFESPTAAFNASKTNPRLGAKIVQALRGDQPRGRHDATRDGRDGRELVAPVAVDELVHHGDAIGVDGEQCGNAPTPALIPQIDMYVWTGGSLYFAM